MGVARFAFTPILPLMESQASMSSATATACATSNYLGYLVGALAGLRLRFEQHSTSTRIARTAAIAACASLAAMPLVDGVLPWVVLRFVAGAAGALLFVVAVDELLSGGGRVTAGWAFGGVGAGIAVSGAVASVLGDSWRWSWWGTAAAAATMTALAWRRPSSVGPGALRADAWHSLARGRYSFPTVWCIYTLEGLGYIIAGTFLVAAVAEVAPGRLGAHVWIAVGLCAIPSCAAWTWLATRVEPAAVLSIALILQATGVVLPTLGGRAAAAMASGVLFGATIIGVPWLAVALGRTSGRRNHVALMTVGYSIGQVLGPIAVHPLQGHGYQLSLVAAAGILGVAALLAGALAVWSGRPGLARTS